MRLRNPRRAQIPHRIKADVGFNQMMMKRLVLILGFLAATFLIGTMVDSCIRSDTLGSGSPGYAKKWMGRFGKLEKPQDARRISWSIGCHTYPDGTWICAIAEDSHGNADGGTIVTRDSEGHIRAFFGHVCIGSFDWVFSTAGHPQTLAEFYTGLARRQYTEYKQSGEANNTPEDIRR